LAPGGHADPIHRHQLSHHRLVVFLVQATERQTSLDDVPGDIAQEGDLRAAEAGAPHGFVVERQHADRIGRPIRREEVAEPAEDGIGGLDRQLLRGNRLRQGHEWRRVRDVCQPARADPPDHRRESRVASHQMPTRLLVVNGRHAWRSYNGDRQ
jgi:hypothetical protein